MSTTDRAGSSRAYAANVQRNDQLDRNRRARWQPARAALWDLLDPLIEPGARVAVIGVGNGETVPLRELSRRAGQLDLIDLDAAALRRARRRLRRRRRVVNTITEDVTFGQADAIAAATISNEPICPTTPLGLEPAGYDVVVADLLFSQLLYPLLADAGLPAEMIDRALLRHGPALTRDVVGWLHRSTRRGGRVIHVHDLLGWWPGHAQRFALDTVLALAGTDLLAALTLARSGHAPYGCDPVQACRELGVPIRQTAFWRWPFAADVDYLVCASVITV